MVRIELHLQIQAPIERCFDLSRSIEVHLLGTEQSGERAVGGVTTGLMELGQSVRWRAKHLGVTQHLTGKITAFDRPTYFQDTMTEGAFKFMQHDHRYIALSVDLTEMIDIFTFAAPMSVLGILAERLILRDYMEKFLRKRNLIIKQVAESSDWGRFLTKES